MHSEYIVSPSILYTLLGVYAPGTLLCLAVLITFIWNTQLLNTRLDLITAGLVLWCFTWGLGRCFMEALVASGFTSVSNKAGAAFTSICMINIFTFNLLLSMERYFSIRGINGTSYYNFVYSFLGLSAVAVIAIFATCNAEDGIRPDLAFPVQLWTWNVLAFVSFGGCVVGMVFFYYSTFRYTANLMYENPQTVAYFLKPQRRQSEKESSSVADLEVGSSSTRSVGVQNRIDMETLEAIRLKVEKQLLLNCFIMSSGVVALYSPMFLFTIAHILRSEKTLDDEALFSGDDAFYFIGVVGVALDVVLTPVLVIYFRKELRRILVGWLWLDSSRGEADV